MEDTQIITLYWQRNECAIAETEHKYGSYLHKIAYNILSNQEDSRESVNDTYLAAWDSMPPQKPNILSAYLAKLVRRISIDAFRYRTREKRMGSQYAISLTELEDCLPGGSTPEEALNARLLAQAIAAFLRRLPPEPRRVFIGRYYYLDPLKEVAAYCGITESKAKTLLYRTRLSLKDYLEKEGFLV